MLALAVLAGAGVVAYRMLRHRDDAAPRYTTQRVARGRILQTVTATGTISPLKTVQVGSQVSGRVAELYADFNSRVEKGDVVARIDARLFQSDVARARANLQSARANLAKAEAQLEDARRRNARAQKLAAEKLLAQADADAASAAEKSAVASRTAAQADVAQARAALEQAEVNLAYTTILSPIDGVVISRNVDVGQTVAASLSAPTLFTIAEDMRAMELHTSVAESDVGSLTAGMKVEFTVDAFPSERFGGVVTQIRNSPTTVQNVVTYDAVVRVDNPELQLRPGMTANVTFIIQDRYDVLAVPSTALRFRPAGDADAADRAGARGETAARTRRVYVLQAARPTPVRVQIGISDGKLTEVVGGELREGALVVTGTGGGTAIAAPAADSAARQRQTDRPGPPRTGPFGM
jgi:HlyD family secretion protein